MRGLAAYFVPIHSVHVEAACKEEPQDHEFISKVACYGIKAVGPPVPLRGVSSSLLAVTPSKHGSFSDAWPTDQHVEGVYLAELQLLWFIVQGSGQALWARGREQGSTPSSTNRGEGKGYAVSVDVLESARTQSALRDGAPNAATRERAFPSSEAELGRPSFKHSDSRPVGYA